MTTVLIIIILLLTYISFFTPEKIRQRKIRRVQKIFDYNAKHPIKHPVFKADDPRNQTHSDEFVLYEHKNGQTSLLDRGLALMIYSAEESLRK